MNANGRLDRADCAVALIYPTDVPPDLILPAGRPGSRSRLLATSAIVGGALRGFALVTGLSAAALTLAQSASGASSSQPGAAPEATATQAPAGARKPRQKAGDKSMAAALAQPSAAQAYAFTKAPPLSVAPAWTGLYAGVSFGPALMQAGTSVSTHSIDQHIVPAPSANTTTTDRLDTGSGKNWGALSDFFLGYNFRLGGNVVAGVQAEGTIANAQAQLGVAQTNLQVQVITITSPVVTTSTTSALQTSNVVDTISERFAASALVRLGVLVDPRDLLYGVGGYTYGGFAWDTRSFGLNGATVGAGWERQIAPGWTFKAEYRYTAFESKDVSAPATSQTTNKGGGSPSTDVFNSAETARASGINLQAFRFGLTHYLDGNGPETALGAYTKVPRGPAPTAMQPWEGIYGGTSFGLAWIKTGTSLTHHTDTAQTSTLANGTVVAGLSTNDQFSSDSGSGRGALTDLYVGYNVRLGDKVVAGLQAEGTIADNEAALSFAQTSVTNSTAVTTPPGTTSTGSSVSTASGLDDVTQRWGASVLGRVGLLADPRDFFYAIGGYTYGGFQWGLRSFGLNGATVGGGWEHEIAPSWTFKAEYRYTAFEDKDLSFPSNATTNQTITTNGAVATSVISSSTAAKDRVSGLSTQAVRFGISHYFGGADGAPGPYAMALEAPKAAPAAPVPMWTGLYGGGSFGLTSVEARSDSTVSQLSTTLVQATPGGRSDVSPSILPTSIRGRHDGGAADLFVGYNAFLAPRVIGGVQLEAGLAHAAVLDNGVFTQTSTETVVSNGVTTTSTGTASGNNLQPALQMRWMASALAKVGWLADPRDLVYVIGGWSYGAFTSLSRPFGLNGPTVGAGWEREIAPGWSVKAEYRYAQLRGGDEVLPNIQASTTPSGSTTTTTTFTQITTDHFAVDIHAVRVGVSHYFGAP